MTEIEKIYIKLGAKFVCNIKNLKNKFLQIKSVIFDWDGVFNSGTKTDNFSSTFSEPDSLGINLLRFALWLKEKSIIPIFTIITAVNNRTAIAFAKREHFNIVYLNYKEKIAAFYNLFHQYNLKSNEIAYIFDDILDIPIAQDVGLRFLVNRPNTPLFTRYILKNNLCDYISANPGGKNAIREICELLLAVSNNYEKVIKKRIYYDNDYKNYITLRNQIKTVINESIN